MSQTAHSSSAHAGGPSDKQYRIPASSGWAGAWKIALAVAAVGAVVSFAGYSADPHRFAFAYLFALVVSMTIGFGAMFFVLIQHLTVAGWSVSVRRVAEFFLSAAPVLALFAAPIVFVPALREALYPWAVEHTEQHGVQAHQAESEHSEAHTGTVVGPHGFLVNDAALHHEHEEILAWKHPYLNLPFFYIRWVVYALVWGALSMLFFRWSTRQDRDGDASFTIKSQRFAPIFTLAFALTLTFAAFDWIMSLEPSWYSTIFGVYIFAGAAVSIFALVIVFAMGLRDSGLLGKSVNEEHFHDLGKLMFGFNVFWAYIGFSQFMLIWYASIPEETTFYHMRWANEGWRFVSLSLPLLHFAAPFVFLISRNVKRALPWLRVGALWMLLMQVVDIYWLVIPYAAPGRFDPHWMDLGCLLFLVGTYLTIVLFRMTKHPLVAVGDPRLARALTFQNA